MSDVNETVTLSDYTPDETITLNGEIYYVSHDNFSSNALEPYSVELNADGSVTEGASVGQNANDADLMDDVSHGINFDNADVNFETQESLDLGRESLDLGNGDSDSSGVNFETRDPNVVLGNDESASGVISNVILTTTTGAQLDTGGYDGVIVLKNWRPGDSVTVNGRKYSTKTLASR